MLMKTKFKEVVTKLTIEMHGNKIDDEGNHALVKE
jgi:hypothetical protein